MTRIQKPRSSHGTWIVGLALGFTVLCLLASVWLLSPSTDPTRDGAPAPIARRAVSTPVAESPPARAQAPLPVPHPAIQTSAASPTPPSEPTPEARTPGPSEPAEGLHLYRPGTKPLKQGLVVPEGFPLPDGYMRHYQSTDTGEQVKPILMFRDDYKPVDAKGRPIELPSNRVVPPELAPPGMPLEVLELPAGPEGVEPIP